MSAPTRRPGWRWVRRIGLGLLGLIALVVVSGSIWEWTSRRSTAERYPPPGKLVDVGGRRMHLDCRGTGSPTVVLESGLDINGSLAWQRVHDSIAVTTRTCGYDRAGVMWSDSKSTPQSGSAIAEDLNAALAAGGESGPFVLVGHSLGGPYTMVFVRNYPDQVAGVVFVDASHPDQVPRLQEARGSKVEPSMTPFKVASALGWTGVVRLAAGQGGVGNQPADGAARMAAYASHSLSAMLQEFEALDATLADAGSLRTLGDRPLVVLTAMAPMPEEALAALKITRAQAEEFQATWQRLHDEEASWSSRSRHEIVPDASHYIQFDRPDLVIAAAREVVGQVRAGVGNPADSTVKP